MSDEAKDYGEPWIEGEMGWLVIVNALGQHNPPELVLDGGIRRWRRIVACVNALRGVPDPEAFVRAADEFASEMFEITMDMPYQRADGETARVMLDRIAESSKKYMVARGRGDSQREGTR